MEANGSPIAEGVYELYAPLMSTPTSEQLQVYCWRSYHLVSLCFIILIYCLFVQQHNGDYVSLMESPYLISHGTTGLTTWQVESLE